MISGALLLEKDEPIKDVLKKRVLKMVIVLVVISGICYMHELVFHNIPFEGWGNIKDFIGNLWSGNIYGHLWFMYSYIAFLMLLPFLRALVREMKKNNMFQYFFALVILFQTVIPIVQYLIFKGEHELYESFGVFTIRNIVMPCIGYWVYRCLDYEKIKDRHILLLWLVNVITNFLSCGMTYLTITSTHADVEQVLEQFFYTFATVNAVVIFVTVKKYYRPIKDRLINCVVSSMAEATFGIFLFHFLMFNLGWFLYLKRLLASFGFPMIGWFAVTAIYFGICWIMVLILKKIPMIKIYI